MDGFKILYVEDDLDPDKIIKLFKRYLTDETIIELENNASEDELADKKIIKILSVSPIIEVVTNVVDALEKLKNGADKYLLFIVDRQLEKNEDITLDKIKAIWPEVHKKKYEEKNGQRYKYLGDIILEYLCLNKGLIQECKQRFRFLTANYDKEILSIKKFLMSYSFEKNIIDAMIIGKGGDKEKELIRHINNVSSFYIQYKHKNVFDTLFKEKYDVENIVNLIDALAYIEGKNKKLPSVRKLRALLESFRIKLKESLNPDKGIKEFKDYFGLALKELESRRLSLECNKKNISHDEKYKSLLENSENRKSQYTYNIQKGHVECLFKPNSYIPYISGYIEKTESKEFVKENEHYSYISQLIWAMSSQEIHHNERESFSGYRLHLIVYGLCELLIFYKKLSDDRYNI